MNAYPAFGGGSLKDRRNDHLFSTLAKSDSYVNVRIAGPPVEFSVGSGRYSNQATVARITNAAISADPSNGVASPSPVICQTMIAVPSSAPM